jgi:DNA-binding transcriptional LysR family regulator
MTGETSSVEPARKLGAGIAPYMDAVSDADIRLLRIFCVVVASGGLSAATTELQADLSTVSRHIKDLEDKCGARLCNRGRSGFSLTPHGQLVHSAVQELFRALDAFRENINTLHADPVGELKFGVMDALLTDPQFPLAAALHVYRKTAPRVRMRLSVCKPHDIARQVLSGELDAGMFTGRDKPAGLTYHPLYHEKSSLYCAERHPCYHKRDAEIDLDGGACLDLVEDPYTDSLPLRSHAGVLRRAACADSIEAVALLISSGDYVGFLPDHFAHALSASIPLRRIRPDVFSYDQAIELVWKSGPVSNLLGGLFAQLGIQHTTL